MQSSAAWGVTGGSAVVVTYRMRSSKCKEEELDFIGPGLGLSGHRTRQPNGLAETTVATVLLITVQKYYRLLPMAVTLPGSIEPVIPTAEAAEAAGASLRDLARFRASHGLR